jgi:hypothetical protein
MPNLRQTLLASGWTFAMGDLLDSSEPVARLNYAKAVCHAREGTVSGEQPKAGYRPA